MNKVLATYKEPAIICDLDGTLALKHSGRTWYDASTCDADIPNEPIRLLVDFVQVVKINIESLRWHF